MGPLKCKITEKVFLLSVLNLKDVIYRNDSPKPWTGIMLNMFCPNMHLCPKLFPALSKKQKSGLNLAKGWLFTSVIQDTNVIVGLKVLITRKNLTTVLCAQGKKINLVQN